MLCYVVFLLLLLPVNAFAERELPNAPALPSHTTQARLGHLHLTEAAWHHARPKQNHAAYTGAHKDDMSAPRMTVFPHPKDAPWLINGYTNIIFQAHAKFHSPYEGPHSFAAAAESATSILDSLHTGYAWHFNSRYETDFLVDLQSLGGGGLSDGLGLAGAPNLDVSRSSSGPAPFLSRGEIFQTIGLTNKMVPSQRGSLNLATKVPARRIEIRVGKMALSDQFDVNSVGSDPNTQFENWTVDNNGAWDFAADGRGYTVGGLIGYDSPKWDFRYGIFAMPIAPNSQTLDWAFSRANGQNFEFDLFKSLIPGKKGAERILAYMNTGDMGNYSEAVKDYQKGLTPRPELSYTAKQGAVKYGFGWNEQQQVTKHLALCTRFGWSPGKYESFNFTEVEQTVEVCGDYTGGQWGRPNDKVGFAFVSNAIKRPHQRYLADGGIGFLLGDGKLNYGRENIEESYYNFYAGRGVSLAFDVQHIADPGYNRARGPVWIEGFRTHISF